MKSGKNIFKLSRSQWISAAVLASSLGLAVAVTLPFPTFTAGTPASASQVTDNFAALSMAVTAAEGQIATLQAGVVGFDAQTNILNTALTTTTIDIASVTVSAPRAGFVILTGNGVFRASHTNTTLSFVRGFLTTTSALGDFDNLTFFEIPATAPTGTYSSAFSITRVFPVTAGDRTFFMTANTFSGAGSILRHNLTAVFVATQL